MLSPRTGGAEPDSVRRGNVTPMGRHLRPAAGIVSDVADAGERVPVFSVLRRAMRIDPRFHVVVVLATASLICGSVLLFNLFVDSFGMYRLFETDGSHAAKPAAYRRVKLAKAYDLRRVEPEAIVLGTSRSHVALRMMHDGWKVPLGRRYNAAFDGATTKEMDAYLRHAHAVKPLRQVVLGLDFWQLGYGVAWTRKDFDPSILFEPEEPLHNVAVYAADLSLLVSIDTTKASIALLRNGDSGGPQWLAPDGQRLGDVFFRRIEPTYASSPGSYFRDIDRQEIGFMLDTGPAVPTAEKTRAGRFSPFPCVFRLYCQNHRILPRQRYRPANFHNTCSCPPTGNRQTTRGLAGHRARQARFGRFAVS